MTQQELKKLANTILNRYEKGFIDHVNKYGFRKFDPRLDIVYFSLSEKQFKVIKDAYALSETQILCARAKIDQIKADNKTVSFVKNERMGNYEAKIKFSSYTDDLDEREVILDQLTH